MARKHATAATRKPGTAAARKQSTVIAQVLEGRQSTVLELIDELLNKGVMATGDVTLGVAGIDLIYLRLSALLCAADRILPSGDHASGGPNRRSRKRRLELPSE